MPWRPGATGPHGATDQVATYSIRLKGGFGHVYFTVPKAQMQRVPRYSRSGVVVMGRLRGGPAVGQTWSMSEELPTNPVISLDGAHIVELDLDGLDSDRLESMRNAGLQLRQPAVGELVREAAARAQASTPFTTERTDIDGFRAVVRLLVAYFYQTGHVDARRALKRSNIDKYLVERTLKTRRTVRWQLYCAGRVLYPGEFPPRAVVEAPRQTATPASTEREIAALYTIASTLGPKWSRAMTCLVDFIGGVGARPAELKHLRRTDVSVEVINGVTCTVVTLQTASSEPRRVPVWDQQVAARIRRHAATARHDLIAAFGDAPTVERNAINRINERLSERGYSDRLNAKALRNFWLVQMASILPIIPFLQIAGTSSTFNLTELGLRPTEVSGNLDHVAAAIELAREVASR
ncbi:hypothetical protein [Gordonia malaquae]|uniref:hypothetical protein n=1 Tax=Gordonia malaquae TaxID=410332 RepID=UPI0030FE15F8